jgi:hypothetical protein
MQWIIIHRAQDIYAITTDRLSHNTTNLLQPHGMVFIFAVETFDKSSHLYFTQGSFL